MTKKTNISLAKRGMNRATLPSQLNEQEYTFAKNVNLESLDGDNFSLSNEYSNILASKLKDGYKVVGYKNDINLNKTFFFLTNPQTGVSEFGYITNINNLQDIGDVEVECSDCNYKNILSTPLEDVIQTEYQSYVTLLSDCVDNLCFNLSIYHRIKKIEIKTEKTDTIIVFTDNFNPPRYILLDHLSIYSYSGEIVCADDSNVIPTCLACEKMKVFKDFSIPSLIPHTLITGGRLKMGSYEFLIAYCDELGNEISEYYSLTNPISIFDANNSTLLQENLADRTKFSIKLNVENLDKNYTSYKIVVIQTADINNATSYFVEGIHPINDNTIIYSTEENKQRTDISHIIKQNIFVKRWEGLTQSNNYLFGYGIEVEKEINLQPIANLMGQFLRWQVHIAPEDLYQNGINSSLYTGYNRDEVVPFGIRFYTKTGYRTSIFNLPGRLSVPNDLLSVDNDDKNSIEANLVNCVESVRDKRWQFYNDATVEGHCTAMEDIPTIEVIESETRTCYIEDIATANPGNFEIELSEPFTNLKEYIEDHQGDCITEPLIFGASDLCSILDITQYSDQDCSDSLFEDTCIDVSLVSEELEITSITGKSSITLTGTSGEANIIINSIVYPIIFNTDLTTTALDFVTTHFSALLALGITVTETSGVLYFISEIEDTPTIVIVNTLSDLNGVVDIHKSYVGTKKLFPSEYSKVSKPKNCLLYETDTSSGSGGQIRDVDFERQYLTCVVLFPPDVVCPKAYKRAFDFSNTDCSYAENLQNITNTSQPIQGYFHNYYGGDTVADLQTTKNAGCVTTEFTDKIHIGALWFKGDRADREDFLLEVSKQNDPSIDDDISMFSQMVRVSIYQKCSSTTPLYCEVVSLNNGAQYLISDITSTSFKINNGTTVTSIITPTELKTFFVVIDTPMIGTAPYTDWTNPDDGRTEKFILSPTDGCFGVVTRDTENSSAIVSWNSITFRKKSSYTADCYYEQPVVQKCKAFPFRYGKFGYYESLENYSDNEELFNSKNLLITEDDIPDSIKDEFENSFVEVNTSGVYTLNDNANLTCKPIRHSKFPDNKVAPFMYENTQAPFNLDIIYPLGVTIDERIINAFLDIACSEENNLITKEQRDSIVRYEIMRGDISNDRSIKSSGLLYDVRSYVEKGKSIYYSNYPFNDLGKDKLNLNTVEDELQQNSKFTFHSPETDYYRAILPNEMSIQGYMFGKSRGHFNEVKSHPKWVILSSRGRDLAGRLAGLEVSADIAIRSAQTLAATGQSYQIGIGYIMEIFNIGGIAVSIAAYAADLLANIAHLITDYGRYRYEWLKIFRDLGQPHNFAYYYSAEGFYNYLKPLQQEGQMLRALNVAKKLKPNKSIIIDENIGKRMSVNNIDREESVFLSTGNFPIDYTDASLAEYYSYDNNVLNNNTSSITFASESSDCKIGKSGEIIKNIASPYVALKDFIAAQYGTISSIKWLSTGYTGDLLNPSSDCLSIFGGDTFITRHTLKRKLPLFLTDAMGIASMTPYNYSFYSNIGSEPKFYVDYETNVDSSRNGILFPDVNNKYKMDCVKRDGNYIVPSKFYLYYYGIPNFLCETRINTNYRYGHPELEKSFYPDIGDITDWTQQIDVPIKAKNYFFYNEVYSKKAINMGVRTLPDNYSKVIYDITYDRPNGVMYSLPDNEENNLNEPWLIYRPFDFYEFPTSYGKLKDLRGIENTQVLGRFENQTAIFNAVDVTVETGQQVTGNNMGNGGIFARRPITFSQTDLGYMGSQTSEMISCEFGHFFVDAKRGHVFKIAPGGKDTEEISSFIGGKSSGMSYWFKKNLPFKILENIPEVDTDNALNGIGITMGWDSRFKRVFITKKDYRLKSQYLNNVSIEDNKFIYTGGITDTEIFLTDSQYFIDVSWTIAFSTVMNSWLSYYDFKPNYYINHHNYFQTGVNQTNDSLEIGLWSHLLTNKSFQVFYGKKYSFEIEYPDKNLFNTRTLHSVNLWTEARRYHDIYDYAYNPNITFNRAVIFNNNNNSGNLNLIPQKGNLVGNKNYPKTNSDNTQDILISNRDNFEWSFDYLFNRVKDNVSNEPNWLWDENKIDKTINPKAVSFHGKKLLDYLTGDYFLIKLGYDKDSRFNLVHKWSTQDYNV